MKPVLLLLAVSALAFGQVPPMIPSAPDGGPVGGAGNLTTVGSVPYVSASGILNQDAGQFFWDATNNRLGIGTNAPTQSLHIWNSSTVTARIQTTGNASASFLFSRPNREFYVGNGPCTATDSFNICDATASNAVRLLIDSTGNVGIGTITPLAPLQTSLVSTATINEIGAIIERTGGSASGLARGVGIVFKDASNATLVGGVAGIREGPGIDWAGGLGFFTNTAALPSTTFANLTERMRILGNGNVGIGTTAPAQTLHVKSANNEILSDATTGDATVSTAIAGVRKWSMYNQGPGNNLWFYDWTNSVARMVVQPGTATAMTILASGNVGIGTAIPGYKLEVAGSSNTEIARVGDGTRSFGISTYTPNSGGVTFKNAGTGLISLTTANAVLIGTGYAGLGSGVSANTVAIEGNVGIGTTTPAYALQVVGQINIPDTNSYIWGTGTSYISGSSASNFITLNTNVTERMRITSAGNVGIGTTTPGSLLSVNGRASANLFGSETNCSSSAGPAVCAAAAAGSVIIPASGTDVTVNTTAVTANSQIFAIFDQSLGTKLGVTCNSTTANPHIGARVAGTSFTIHANVSPVTNPACFSYFIIN